MRSAHSLGLVYLTWETKQRRNSQKQIKGGGGEWTIINKIIKLLGPGITLADPTLETAILQVRLPILCPRCPQITPLEWNSQLCIFYSLTRFHFFQTFPPPTCGCPNQFMCLLACYETWKQLETTF